MLSFEEVLELHFYVFYANHTMNRLSKGDYILVEKKVVVVNESGIHAPSAASVVNFVRNYHGMIEIRCNEKKANLKSILSILSLGIKHGSVVTLCIEGENEELFANELTEFIGKL